MTGRDFVVGFDDLATLLLIGHDGAVLLELVHGLLDAPQQLTGPCDVGRDGRPVAH